MWYVLYIVKPCMAQRLQGIYNVHGFFFASFPFLMSGPGLSKAQKICWTCLGWRVGGQWLAHGWSAVCH